MTGDSPVASEVDNQNEKSRFYLRHSLPPAAKRLRYQGRYKFFPPTRVQQTQNDICAICLQSICSSDMNASYHHALRQELLERLAEIKQALHRPLRQNRTSLKHEGMRTCC